MAISLKIPEIKWHSFSNEPCAVRNKMPVEQENNIIYFISELETETKNVNLILKKIKCICSFVLPALLEGNIVFLGLK